MHFDDRLLTVLRQPISGEAIARIQFIQLLDLLGTADGAGGAASPDAAYERLAVLSQQLAAQDKARLLRESGLRLRNARLITFFADDAPAVASAAIAVADLREDEWLELIPALPVRSRGILRHRRGLGPNVEARLERLGISDRGLPAADFDLLANDGAPDAPNSGKAEHGAGIGAIVRRIEAYRKEHPSPQRPFLSDAPRLPLGDPDHLTPFAQVDSFDFVTDAQGQIVRAESLIAPMLVGLSLTSLECGTGTLAHPAPRDALGGRQPIRRQVVAIDGGPAITGEWQIDAAPLFRAATGGFSGYAGKARRVATAQATALPSSEDADRMRQILHELRNPAGAIQLGSEMIQQQALGDVPHEYRAIAASIASDTALVLAGLEELERLVKLSAGALPMTPGQTDMWQALQATIAQIHRHSEQRQSGFDLIAPDFPATVALDRGELSRLLWRLLAALATEAGPGERLALALFRDDNGIHLEIALPTSLRDVPDDELYHAQAADRPRALSSGMFGLGFALRLAAAEAGAAGGALRRRKEQLILTLPGASQPSTNIRTA